MMNENNTTDNIFQTTDLHIALLKEGELDFLYGFSIVANQLEGNCPFPMAAGRSKGWLRELVALYASNDQYQALGGRIKELRWRRRAYKKACRRLLDAAVADRDMTGADFFQGALNRLSELPEEPGKHGHKRPSSKKAGGAKPETERKPFVLNEVAIITMVAASKRLDVTAKHLIKRISEALPHDIPSRRRMLCHLSARLSIRKPPLHLTRQDLLLTKNDLERAIQAGENYDGVMAISKHLWDCANTAFDAQPQRLLETLTCVERILDVRLRVGQLLDENVARTELGPRSRSQMADEGATLH